MESLVVIRVGTPNPYSSLMFSQSKWSSPELPNSQVVRDQFMEGKTVYVLFIGSNNLPVYMGKVSNVRLRDPNLDSTFPLENEDHVEFKTIIIFSPDSLQPIINISADTFTSVISYITFKRGSQILISDRHISTVLIAFYRGLYQAVLTTNSHINNQYIGGNITVINPNYNLNGF